MELNKDNLINKYLQIEMLTHRMESMAHIGRHHVEMMDMDKMKQIAKHLRNDLIELEEMLGME